MPAPRAKSRITGVASQLNRVADSTCHIGGSMTPLGIGVAISNTTGQTAQRGRKQASGFDNKNCRLMRTSTRRQSARRITITTSLTSKRPSAPHPRGCLFWAFQPHFESPQLRQVMQLSIMTTAAVLHLVHSCAPSGKCDFANASACLARASNSARFSSMIFC
jgi:hypothetical protein